MNASLPKIAVCFPSGDMVHADFALALAGMLNSTPPLDTPIVNNKSSIVAAARNDGVKRAREMGCDYILFLDSDMVFPRDTLHRLLVHREAIVGATYVKRVPPYPVLGTAAESEPTCDARGLTEMLRIPTGCLLIRMSVFDALKPPYFRFVTDEASGDIIGEDYDFCDRARQAGFHVWCDAKLSLLIGHVGQKVFRFSPEERA